MDWEDFAERLARELKRLPVRSFLIVQAPSGLPYVQAIRSSHALDAEAVGSAFLPRPLTHRQERRLGAQGWRKPDGRERLNFSSRVPMPGRPRLTPAQAEAVDALAQRMVEAFRDVYGTRGPLDLVYQAGSTGNSAGGIAMPGLGLPLAIPEAERSAAETIGLAPRPADLETLLTAARERDDEAAYLDLLRQVNLCLPVPGEPGSDEAGRFATARFGDGTFVLAFTSPEAMERSLRGQAVHHRPSTLAELTAAWPNPAWQLAVNPGLPSAGYLDATSLTPSPNGTGPTTPAPQPPDAATSPATTGQPDLTKQPSPTPQPDPRDPSDPTTRPGTPDHPAHTAQPGPAIRPGATERPGHAGQAEPQGQPGPATRPGSPALPGHTARAEPQASPGPAMRPGATERPGHAAQAEPQGQPGPATRPGSPALPGHTARAERQAPPGPATRPGHTAQSESQGQPGLAARPGHAAQAGPATPPGHAARAESQGPPGPATRPGSSAQADPQSTSGPATRPGYAARAESQGPSDPATGRGFAERSGSAASSGVTGAPGPATPGYAGQSGSGAGRGPVERPGYAGPSGGGTPGAGRGGGRPDRVVAGGAAEPLPRRTATHRGRPAPEPAAAPVQPPPSPEPARSTVIMQKVLRPEHVAHYLDGGYDLVAGYVHRLGDVAGLGTPAELVHRLGLTYAGSPFAKSDEHVHVLRWTAVKPELFRTPLGGIDEWSMQIVPGGWVIETAPFPGSGYAPGDGSPIPEFKIESQRVPHGSEIHRLDRNADERLVAVYDADRRAWRRPEPRGRR